MIKYDKFHSTEIKINRILLERPLLSYKSKLLQVVFREELCIIYGTSFKKYDFILKYKADIRRVSIYDNAGRS